MEKEFCNFVVKTYCDYQKYDNPNEYFVPWDPSIHSKTKSPCEPFDVIFTDDAVVKIVTEYFLSEYGMSRQEKYNFLAESNQLNDVFTPRRNGNFSVYAQNTFGYSLNNGDINHYIEDP